MSRDENSGNGLTRWLAEQFSAIHWRLGELHAGQQAQTERMDRLEDRIMNGRSRRPWWTYLRHIPWQFLLLFALTALVVTGHITLSEIKPAIIKKLQEF